MTERLIRSWNIRAALCTGGEGEGRQRVGAGCVRPSRSLVYSETVDAVGGFKQGKHQAAACEYVGCAQCWAGLLEAPLSND